MSDNVHVFIEKTHAGKRHIVAFSVGDKQTAELYAAYNAVEKVPNLTPVELPLDQVSQMCRYNLSNLTLEMVDQLTPEVVTK